MAGMARWKVKSCRSLVSLPTSAGITEPLGFPRIRNAAEASAEFVPALAPTQIFTVICLVHEFQPLWGRFGRSRKRCLEQATSPRARQVFLIRTRRLLMRSVAALTIT